MANDSVSINNLTRIRPLGYQSGSCGYCRDEDTGRRTPNSRASYYATSHYLLPGHYQELMDRGWRRSGTLLYLPDLARSCCPHYTIRLPAAEFKPSRDQRQVLHRWNRFILGEKYLKQFELKYPLTKEKKKDQANTFDLIGTLHKSERFHVAQELEPDHQFDVTLEPDDFTEEKYLLFEHYQSIVHKDPPEDISRNGFRRFLCSSPIQRSSSRGMLFGSYHQCYRVDGRLVAIGVLDLLPHAVSGVYFIYHTDFEKYSLGKVSALREASLAGEGGYQYYYMGYYIHDCEKMKYKAAYQPQYVLDVCSHTWNVLDNDLRTLMSKKKFVSMSREGKRSRTTAEPSSGGVNTDTGIGQAITEDVDEDDLHEYQLLVPQQAATSGRSLLDIGMPGIMLLPEIALTVDLDRVKVVLGPKEVYLLSDLHTWDNGDELDNSSLKGLAAELSACIGAEVIEEVAVDFSRSSSP